MGIRAGAPPEELSVITRWGYVYAAGACAGILVAALANIFEWNPFWEWFGLIGGAWSYAFFRAAGRGK